MRRYRILWLVAGFGGGVLIGSDGGEPIVEDVGGTVEEQRVRVPEGLVAGMMFPAYGIGDAPSGTTARFERLLEMIELEEERVAGIVERWDDRRARGELVEVLGEDRGAVAFLLLRRTLDADRSRRGVDLLGGGGE